MRCAKMSANLGDPKLLKRLKQEAAMTDQSMKEVLVHALESCFPHRLETKSTRRLGEDAFKEWNNPWDAEYNELEIRG
jgi:hypothetical protein